MLSLADVCLDALDVEGLTRSSVSAASGGQREQWRHLLPRPSPRPLPLPTATRPTPTGQAAAAEAAAADERQDHHQQQWQQQQQQQEQQEQQQEQGRLASRSLEPGSDERPGGEGRAAAASPALSSPASPPASRLEDELLAEARAMAGNPQRWRMGPKLLEVHERQARAGVSEYYTAEHLARLWRHSAGRRRRRRRRGAGGGSSGGGGGDGGANDFEEEEDPLLLYPSARGSKVLCKAVHPESCRACVTCHFCRQKTVDAKTRCACELGGARHQPGGAMRGAWCGSCLALRMGERLADALADPDWRCPCCRDLCNCSGVGCLRARRGLEPTNQLASEARAYGHPSVAHYLVLTHLCSRPELMAPVMADCGRRRAVSIDGAAVAGAAAAAAAPPLALLARGRTGADDAAAGAAAAAAAAAAAEDGAGGGDAAASRRLLMLRPYDLDALVQGRLRAVRLAIVRQVDAQVAAMRLELPLPPAPSAAAPTASRAGAGAESPRGWGRAARGGDPWVGGAPPLPAAAPPPPLRLAGRGFCTGILDLDDGGRGGGGDDDEGDGDGDDDDEGAGAWSSAANPSAGSSLCALLTSARRRRGRAVRTAAEQRQRQEAAAAAAAPAAVAPPIWPPPGSEVRQQPTGQVYQQHQQQQQQQQQQRQVAIAATAASDGDGDRASGGGAWWVRSALWRAGAPTPPIDARRAQQQQDQQQQQHAMHGRPATDDAAAAATNAVTADAPPGSDAPATPVTAAAAATPAARPLPPPQAPPYTSLPAAHGRFQMLAVYVQGLIETVARAEGAAAAATAGAAARARATDDAALAAALAPLASAAPPAPPPGAAAYARGQIDGLMQREFASGWLEDVAVSDFALRGSGGGGGGARAASAEGNGNGGNDGAAPATEEDAAAAAAAVPPLQQEEEDGHAGTQQQQQQQQQLPPAVARLSHGELRAAVDLLLLVATKGPPRAAAEAAERLARRGPFVDVVRSDARARAVVLRGAIDLLMHAASLPSQAAATSVPLALPVAALAASALDVVAAVADEARALRRLLAAPRDHTGPLCLGPVDLPADRRPGSAAARLAQLGALLRADEELLALALARLQETAEALGRGARAFMLAPGPGGRALATLLDAGSGGGGGAPAAPPFGRALRCAALAAAYTVVASAAPDVADDRAWRGGGGGSGVWLGPGARLAELRELERAARRTLLAPVERLVEAAYPGRRGRAAAVEAALAAAGGGAGADAGGGGAGGGGLLGAAAAAALQAPGEQQLSLRQQQQQQLDAQGVGSIAVEVLARLYALQAQALCVQGGGVRGGAAPALPQTPPTTTQVAADADPYTSSPALSWTVCVETPLHAPFTSPDLFWTHCSSLRARHLAVFGAAHALAASPSALSREGVAPLLRLWLRGLVDYGRRFSVAYLTLVLAGHPRTGLALFAAAPSSTRDQAGSARGRGGAGGVALPAAAAAAAARARINDGGGVDDEDGEAAQAAAAWSDVVRDGPAGDLRAALARRVLKSLLSAHGLPSPGSSEAAERLAAPHPLHGGGAAPSNALDGPGSVLAVCAKLVDVLNARKAELVRAQVGDDDPRRLLCWQRAASAVALAAADALAESSSGFSPPHSSFSSGRPQQRHSNARAAAAAAATVPLLLEWVALAFRTAFAAVCSARARMVAGGRDAASAAAGAAGILPSSAIVLYLPALSAIGRLEELHGFRLAEEARPAWGAGGMGGGLRGGGGGGGVGGATGGAAAATSPGPCLRRALLGAMSAVLDEPSALDDPPHAEDHAAVLHVARALARAGAMDAAPALAHHALGVHVRLALEEATAAAAAAAATATTATAASALAASSPLAAADPAAVSAAAAGGMPAWTWRRAVNALRLLECLFCERAARDPATLALLAPCVLRPLVALLSLPPPLPPAAAAAADGGNGAFAAEAYALRLERYSLLQRRALGAVAALLLGESADARPATATRSAGGGGGGAGAAGGGGGGVPSGATLPSIRPDPASAPWPAAAVASGLAPLAAAAAAAAASTARSAAASRSRPRSSTRPSARCCTSPSAGA